MLGSGAGALKLERSGFLSAAVGRVGESVDGTDDGEALLLLLRQANLLRLEGTLGADHFEELTTELFDALALCDCLAGHLALVVPSTELDDLRSTALCGFAGFRLDCRDVHLIGHDDLLGIVGLNGDLRNVPAATNADCHVSGDRNDACLDGAPRFGHIGVLLFALQLVDGVSNGDIRTDTVHHVIEDLAGKWAFSKAHRRTESPCRAIKVYRFDHADLLLRIMVQQKRGAAAVKERKINRLGGVLEHFHPEAALDWRLGGDGHAHAALVSVDGLRVELHSPMDHLGSSLALLLHVAAILSRLDGVDLRKGRKAMAHHHVGGLAFAVKDSDERGRIIGLAVDHHVSVGHLDLAIAHDFLDLAPGRSASTVPANEVADAELIRFCAFHGRCLLSIFVIITAIRLICGIHALDNIIGPGLARVAAPEGPRDAPSARVALLARAEAFALLVHLMARKKRFHALHGVEAEALAVADVSSSSHAHLGAAASVLLAPLQASLCLGHHPIGGGGADFDAFISGHELSPMRRSRCRTRRRRSQNKQCLSRKLAAYS